MSILDNVQTSMVPPSGLAVPTRPEELDPVWLTGCLRHAGVLQEGERVRAFETERIGQGRGFAGQIVRVTLQYEPVDAAAPKCVIAKFASQHESTRELLGDFDGYAREVRFYRELASEVGVGVPRCYFAHYDLEHGQFCLVLEDMAPAASADREQGYTVEQAKQVLEQLAAMHARFWNRTDEVPWLVLSDALFHKVRERFIGSLPRFVAEYGAQYPALTKVARRFVVFLQGNEVFEEVRRPPLTIAHNDMHIENVFLPTAQGGRFAFVDWQSVGVARYGTSDVARVLCMGLRPELRRVHVGALLRHYHRALRARGVHGYSLFALRLRYRQELVAAVLIAVMAFDALDFGVHREHAPRLLAQRVDSALADAHVSALLAVLGVWLRVRRWVLRAFGRTRPRNA